MLANINCDMGEAAGHDELIMPFITAANIACGYHAGDVISMQRTVELCIQNNVAIGAHPSFYDRDNFGRKEMHLPAGDIYELVIQQLIILSEVASHFDKKIGHVKPHGALYNMSAKDPGIAAAIAKAVKEFDGTLILYGLSGSHSIAQAKTIGLQTASETFADRSYQDDGSLTPRSQPNAMLEDETTVVQQVLQMLKEKTVTSVSGKKIPVIAETICIHGDGEHAAEFAKAIYQNLEQNNIAIKTF